MKFPVSKSKPKRWSLGFETIHDRRAWIEGARNLKLSLCRPLNCARAYRLSLLFSRLISRATVFETFVEESENLCDRYSVSEFLYLRSIEEILSAAMPESNPQIVPLPALNTTGLEITLLGDNTLTLVVDDAGWGLVANEDPPQVSALGPLDTDAGEVTFRIIAPYVRSLVEYLYPEPGSIDLQAILEGMGPETRNYKLLLSILRFFVLLKDGEIFVDNLRLHQEAQELVDWLGNAG